MLPLAANDGIVTNVAMSFNSRIIKTSFKPFSSLREPSALKPTVMDVLDNIFFLSFFFLRSVFLLCTFYLAGYAVGILRAHIYALNKKLKDYSLRFACYCY